MTSYILRRLLLLPLTLFAIILVNFVILNLAPGDPVTTTDISSGGEASRSADTASGGDHQYLLFREHYGLTLPILFNTWPSISQKKITQGVEILATKKMGEEELMPSELHALKTLWGDRAKFLMLPLLEIATDQTLSPQMRLTAANLFIRGGTRQGKLGQDLTKEEKLENRKIAADNDHLLSLKLHEYDSLATLDEKSGKLQKWMSDNATLFPYPLTFKQKVSTFFFETRFCKYFSKVLSLDFGTLRNDNNKSVISEVGKRMKFSLTLAVIPMVLTFGFCQAFGMLMAVKQNKWPDYTLNTFFLILFAIPVFVVAPFLIEKVALVNGLPISGFHSPEEVWIALTSSQRIKDVILHLFLPLTAVMYGTLAVQSRLSRTAVLEVLRQDFVKVAKAKGLPMRKILVKHVGRNAAITVVTAIATSLGVILGGSLIVETVFEINGFGRFFYEAIINRDYNVMLFSVFAGSFLTLLGYLIADIAYTLLDPRLSLE